MKRKLFAVSVFATAAIAAISIGGGAVTNANGGIPTPAVVTDLGNGAKGVDSGTINPTISKDFKLAATGVNTKTLVLGGVGCGNASMSWDDSPAGAAYKVTNRTSWNAPGTCLGNVQGTIPELEMWAPNGDYSSHGGLADGQTKSNGIDRTGSATTKFQWSRVDADWADVPIYFCAYLIPGGGGYWDTYSCYA